jgi:diketogulonate reductase-like aldo/keto reductase
MIERAGLSKVGMGTWGIGGLVKKDPNNDDKKQIKALRYMFERGINFVEANMWAAEGHSVYLTAQAYKESRVKRENVFLTQTVYQFTVESIADIEKEFEAYAGMFGTDYVDALQFGIIAIRKLGYENIVRLIRQYLSQGKIRYTSVTNSDLGFLRQYHAEFGNKLFAHEVGFNFEIRENETLGITGYAEDNGILNVIYQPLRRNRTAAKNYPLLVELAQKYRKTQNQIILNWIARKGFFPITKSENIDHINEHLASFDFILDNHDVEKLNKFRVPGYQSPKIDWYRDGDGVPVDQLSNQLDDLIKKN